MVAVKKRRRMSRLKRLEKFATRQIEKYIKIHKEHEKDLDYIG